jgi:osmotically-inducible protein OsmY
LNGADRQLRAARRPRATIPACPARHRKFKEHSMSNSLLRRTLAIASFTVLASLTACASTAGQEGTGEYVDDAVITTKVKTAVLNDPELKATEINVETFKGKVQLSGYVNSQADIDQAVAVARAIKGVNSVTNDMRLK